MEKIIYKKTLDLHKNGVQFMLQGFETADNMSRRVELSLMASGDTIDFPLEQITAIMYVTSPGATEPSVNKCIIKDNTIIYDVLPITVEGITEMQIKLIDTRLNGARSVLATPKFAIEVSKSNTDDEGVTQTTTFTALENAIAKAKAVYNSRLLRIELDTDCMFKAYYADGTIYESDILKELFLKGDALLSQSYAKGGTGIRTGEDTDNSMYYSNVSRSASEEAHRISEETTELLTEVKKHGVYTAFSVNFETGEVEYVTPSYKFNINENNGELEAVGNAYTFEETIEYLVKQWLVDNGVDYKNLSNTVKQNSNDINDLSNQFAEIKDYIVEQGVSGIWTYEKWNSGKAKCRGSTTYVADNFSMAFGEGSGLRMPSTGTTEIDYPFEFVERPAEFAFIKRSIFPGITATDVMGRINTTSHTGRYKPVTYTIAASNVTPDTPLEFIVDYIVEGKWK